MHGFEVFNFTAFLSLSLFLSLEPITHAHASMLHIWINWHRKLNLPLGLEKWHRAAVAAMAVEIKSPEQNSTSKIERKKIHKTSEFLAR